MKFIQRAYRETVASERFRARLATGCSSTSTMHA